MRKIEKGDFRDFSTQTLSASVRYTTCARLKNPCIRKCLEIKDFFANKHLTLNTNVCSCKISLFHVEI